jgi:hypothetical protein
VDETQIKIIGHIGTENQWRERRAIIDPYLTTGMKTLRDNRYENHSRGQWGSMGVIKPKEILDFVERDRDTLDDDDPAKQVAGVQMKLLHKPGIEAPRRLDPINKKIGYRFLCGDSDCTTCHHRGHEMMCTDWEISALYRKVGFEKTREQMMKFADIKDMYFMMGTVSQQWNNFIQVGIFYPPKIALETMN